MLTRRAFIVITCCVLFWSATVRPANAQATGSITGVVTDQSSAIMPGVTVEATNTATGQVRNTVSGPDGFYSIPLLQPGRYNVKATVSGFRQAQRDGVDVSVGDTSRADFKLVVGGIAETVIVDGDDYTPLI